MKKAAKSICISSLILLFFAYFAAAHSVILWAYVENGEVYVEAFTQKGTKIKDAQLMVIDKTGKTLYEGKTDAEGKFQFVPSVKEEMTIVMIIDHAHKTEFKLMAEDFEEM